MTRFIAVLIAAAIGIGGFAAADAQAISQGYCLETLYGNAAASAATFVKDNDVKYVWDTIETRDGVNIVSSEPTNLVLLWGDWNTGAANGGIRVRWLFTRANGARIEAFFYCEKATSAHVFTDWPEGTPNKYAVYNGF